ncbi:Putative peptidoglycan binding domain-containing protein [Streptomyces sp. 3213]|uniref:peptidoglycan-binding domain-containing protein n=1 Tax=Streptomyces sp. 3213.3 TaxID=1855348 RepID=UPI0008942162|nr:peptidoglycan-binding domain-containing protein [Streptomyces sp. 3213.3]SEC36577.1 Putative peptidoglycan binding domain-containing protein [Streptomyces sp. 3213] [Streptomyces sp. 3213.3]
MSARLRSRLRIKALTAVTILIGALAIWMAPSASANTACSPTHAHTDPMGFSWQIPVNQLQYGSTGICVKHLQADLNALYGAGLSVDGDFGPQTLSWVKHFQSDNSSAYLPVWGMTPKTCAGGVDGLVGPNTASCIADYLYFESAAADGSYPGYQAWIEPGLV